MPLRLHPLELFGRDYGRSLEPYPFAFGLGLLQAGIKAVEATPAHVKRVCKNLPDFLDTKASTAQGNAFLVEARGDGLHAQRQASLAIKVQFVYAAYDNRLGRVYL
ncbi:MAG: hypothetical protein OEL53_02445 [Rhodospirillales bacterium]|nr:hypothetical protein [Rhodospirillales bacterium]